MLIYSLSIALNLWCWFNYSLFIVKLLWNSLLIIYWFCEKSSTHGKLVGMVLVKLPIFMTKIPLPFYKTYWACPLPSSNQNLLNLSHAEDKDSYVDAHRYYPPPTFSCLWIAGVAHLVPKSSFSLVLQANYNASRGLLHVCMCGLRSWRVVENLTTLEFKNRVIFVVATGVAFGRINAVSAFVVGCSNDIPSGNLAAVEDYQEVWVQIVLQMPQLPLALQLQCR